MKTNNLFSGGLRESGRAAWRSIATLFGRKQRRGYQAQLRLTQAYNAVFGGGSAGPEDKELVLADLANTSGFYRVTPAKHYSSRELWQMEGARLVYARIFEHLRLSEADLRALEIAARREAAVDHDPLERGNNA